VNNHQKHPATVLHDLAPLYALDALEPAERAEFEQHLAGCPQCQAEIAGYEDVVGQLAAGVAQEPPPALRASVLSAIHGTRQGRLSDGGPASDGGTPSGSGPADHQVDTAVVVSLEDRRRRRRRRLLSIAAAAVLAPAIALTGWSLGVQSEQREQQQLAGQEQSRENQLLSAADVAVRPIDVNGQPAALVHSQEQDAALFIAGDLPAPGEGQEYQLWLLEDGTPIPDVHFSGGEVRIWLEGDLDGAGAVALTVEPAGGSTTPTFPVVASAELN